MVVCIDHPGKAPKFPGVYTKSHAAMAYSLATELLDNYLKDSAIPESNSLAQCKRLIDKKQWKEAIELWNTKVRPRGSPSFLVIHRDLNRISQGDVK